MTTALRARRLSRPAFLLVLLWPGAPAAGIDPAIPLPRLMRDAWSTPEGLPQASVVAIAQTTDGFVWMATEEGLARFDGVSFRVLDPSTTPALAHPPVWALLPGSDGSLLVGTAGGLVRVAGGVVSDGPGGIPRGPVRALAEGTDGALWVGTDSGLASVEGSEVRVVTVRDGLADDGIRTLLVARDGAVWAGTRKGLSRVDVSGVTTFGVPEGLPHPYVTSLWEAADGTLWVATNGGGLAAYHGGRFRTLGKKDGLSTENVLSVRQDRHGSLWAGTNGGGLCRLGDGDRFTCLTSREGLPGDIVWSLAEDRQGGFWGGTIGSGAYRLREGRFTTFGAAEGLGADIALPILEDASGTVWIGTAGGGLTRYRDGTFRTFTTRDGLPHGVVLALEEDPSGDLWIGTAGGGVTRMHGERFTTLSRRDGLSSDLVQVLLRTHDGSLWVGTNGGGLCRYARGAFTCYSEAQGMPPGAVGALLEERPGSLLVGTIGGGLARFRDGRFTRFDPAAVPASVVVDLAGTGDGTVWVGTQGDGLLRLRGDEAVAIRRRHGLYDDVVGRILDDGLGNLWMTCNKGVFRVKRSDADAVADGRAASLVSTVYGTADGMRSAECNGGFRPAGWRTRDGRLWFPTPKGAAVVDPAHLRDDPVSPAVFVESVLVDGKPVPPVSPVEVRAGAHALEVSFTAPSFVVPRRVTFRYVLEGFDHGFVDAGTRRTAYYTNVPPGTYSFRVNAANADGVAGDSPATVTVHVSARLSQRWPFLALCLAAVVGAAAGVWRGRLARAQRRQRDLEALVEARTRAEEELRRHKEHLEQLVASRTAELSEANRELEAFTYSVSHDLRAPLRALDGFSRILVEDHGPALGDEGRRLLGVIRGRADEMKELIEGLLRLSTSGRQELRTRPVDSTALVRSVFAELVQADTGAPVELVLDPLPTVRADRDLLRQVWVNLIANALKYSLPKALRRVTIRSRAELGHDLFEVEDTGVGFDPSHADRLFTVFSRLHERSAFEGTGIGLALARRIVERHGGTIGARGVPGEGAAFWFTLPRVLADAVDPS